MKTPETSRGSKEARILVWPHKDRLVTESLRMAAILSGTSDGRVISLVLNQDPPADHENIIGKAYEEARAGRGINEGARSMLIRGEQLRMKAFQVKTEEEIQAEKARLKEMKQAE